MFVGHLVLEKIIKAHYVKDTGKTPPKIHDLVKLASKTKLNFNENQLLFLDEVSDFMIEARYPEYKRKLFKTFTKKYTKEKFAKIKEMFLWLRSQLK